MYSGSIKGVGQDKPSIEDKIVNLKINNITKYFRTRRNKGQCFTQMEYQHLFLKIQLKILAKIKGLEQVKMKRAGYAEKRLQCRSKRIKSYFRDKKLNPFFAGQINGTTGYEEAAAQGLIAGVNAALKVINKRSLF